MKIKTLVIPLLFACVFSFVSAHEKKIAGPNGGRLLTTVEPHAEFFITPERKVQITFVDDSLKPIAPAQQSIVVTTGQRTNPTTLKFARAGNVLLSENTLPEGNNLPAVVQVKVTPEAKTTVTRFNLNVVVCPGCNYAEYACICDH